MQFNRQSLDTDLLLSRVEPAADGPVSGAAALTREHYKVISVAALGGMLEFFEFVTFIFLTPMIGRHFFPADTPLWVQQLQALAIFAAGYLVRPLGGIVLANLGDLVGRKRVFGLTLFLMAVPTLAIGLLPDYAQIGVMAPLALLLCRILQGLSLGGELPGALVFVSEHVDERRLGMAIGTLGASLGLGTFLASGVLSLLTVRLGAQQMSDFGWRIPFLLGGVFGLVSVYLRRYAHETPVFKALRANISSAREVPIKTLLRDYRRETLLCALMTCIPVVIPAAVTLYSVAYLQTYTQLGAPAIHEAQTWMLLSVIFGNLVIGWMSDRLGFVKVFMLASLAHIAALYWFYLGSMDGSGGFVFRYIVLGFTCGYISMPLVALIRSFPVQTRYTGIAVSYNICAALLGGTTPLIVSALTHYDPITVAHLPAAVALLGMLVLPIVVRSGKPVHSIKTGEIRPSRQHAVAP